MIKKHEVLESEVNVREKLVKAVQEGGERLISEGHYASEDVLENSKTLQDSWEKLLETMEKRRKKLCDSLQVQKVGEISSEYHVLDRAIDVFPGFVS